MKEELLYEAVTGIDSSLIEEAQRKGRPAARRLAAAVAAVLAVCIGFAALPQFLGGRQAQNIPTGDGTGGSAFSSYAGPILPISLNIENKFITAQRAVTLDFTPWMPADGETGSVQNSADYLNPTDILVTDQYVFTNHSQEAQTITVRYPYAGDLRNEHPPAMTVDGNTAYPETVFGGDVGGFAGTSAEDDGAWNLREPDAWEAYQDLLADGSYEEAAFGPAPDLSRIPVVLYRFTQAPAEQGQEDQTRVNAHFSQDYEQTRLLTYRFHSGTRDAEAGWTIMGYTSGDPTPRYLVAVGQDIGDIEIRPASAAVDIQREETDLESALREIIGQETADRAEDILPAYQPVDLDAFYDAAAKAFVEYGPLTEKSAERYDMGLLDDFLLDVLVRQRILYLEAEVVVPAGGQAVVTVSMTKEASFDYAGSGGRAGVYGYDLATQLGSNLVFTGQTATVLDHGGIEIVNQDFGFDLENGIAAVSLDPQELHYNLEVARAD